MILKTVYLALCTTGWLWVNTAAADVPPPPALETPKATAVAPAATSHNYVPESIEKAKQGKTTKNATKTKERKKTKKKPKAKTTQKTQAKTDIDNTDKQCIAKCLLINFGSEVCSSAFQKFSEEALDKNAYNVVTSPDCNILISEILKKNQSDSDIAKPVLTKTLDDAGSVGLESEDDFKKVLGELAKFSAFAMKVNYFNQCINRCD